MDRRRVAVIVAVISAFAVTLIILTLLGGGGGGSGSKTSASGQQGGADNGVTVSGKFGERPTLTIPASNPPSQLSAKVLSAGSGPAVQTGQTVVANYLGETWDPKNGQPNVFDSSYDRQIPEGFPIGTGRVIEGWDRTLVGQHVGSRVLLTIPPALAYGTSTSAAGGNDLAGHTLVFVVDILDALNVDVAATGASVASLPTGLPRVTSEPGKRPAIVSVKGVKPVNKTLSAVLVKGTGPAIDPSKSLAMEILQTDIATGKQTQQTWGSGVTILPAAQVLGVVTALTGQNVGSRAVAVTPARGTTPGVILVVDVIAQY